MVTYVRDELAQCWGQSRQAIGLVELGSLEVLYANHAFSRQVEALHMLSGVNPLSDWPQVQVAMQECLQTQTLTSYEHEGWNVRMEILPVTLLCAEGVSQQVLQCQVFPLQDAQVLQERMSQTMMDFLPHNTWACSLKGEVFWANRTSNLFTYGEPEVHDLTHSRYIAKIHPEDIQETGTRFATGMVEGHLEPFRYRLRDHTGQFYWFLFTAKPVKDAQGNTQCWVGQSINIDAMVQTEQQLQAEVQTLLRDKLRLAEQLHDAQAIAVNAQKMDVVTHLAAGVAHDLNNMLFVMGMHLGTLQKKVIDAQLLGSLEAVRDCIRKAARMSTQLSGFSGRLPQNAQPLCPALFLEEALPILTQAVGAEVALSMEVESHLPNVLVDRNYLENALINLLINARDAMQGRGHIHLRAARTERNHDGRTQTFVCVEVSDEGTGISEAMQARVFEPFFTTKDPDKGTGLGLAMVKNFVESSGGWLQLQSTLGQGTTVSLGLPVTQMQVPAAPLAAPKVLASEGVVMLIEDDDAVRQAISLALREMGYGLMAAKNPDQGLALLAAGSKPDLILSDVRMPGKKTVRDLIAYVQTQQHIPLIFITGYSAEIVIQEGLIDGTYPVLFKPFEVAELAQKMHEVMHKNLRGQVFD